MLKERIQKVLARANVASRRKVEEMILEGRVRLNGRKVTELGLTMDPQKDTVQVNGKLISVMPPHLDEKIYILLNKPREVVTTLKDNFDRQTVIDLLPMYKHTRIFPVGRLDYDAQGALLLTNDGELAQKLSHPRYKHEKVYSVKVKGTPKSEDLDKLRRGIYLDDGATGPCSIEYLRSVKNNTWFRVTLTQGKYHQLKRMFFRIYNPVLRIVRTDFAGIPLGDLPVGTHRELNKREVQILKQNF